MQGLKADLLRGCWYLAMLSSDLAPGKTVAKTLLGEPVLFARQADGHVFAIRDACPHRGIPLRYGNFDGKTVGCCYHGWRFDESGTCTEIPSLREDQSVDFSKIRCGSYPVVDRQGVIWIYMGVDGEAPEDGPMTEPPSMPGFAADDAPKAAIKLPFPCSTDHAAFGLMDPTHAAFVHTSWWFKKDATKLRPKEKKFEPSELGWRMVRHPIPPQNIAYKIFGQNVSTEIAYRLPGYRIEHIEGSKHVVVGLTAITPVTDEATEVHQIFWASAGWLKPLRPLTQHLMTVFLDQDRRVVVQQREGLEQGNKTMLINDADTQARWWMRVKGEWMQSQADGRAFVNPLKPQTLRWRS
ncbi:Toluene-4-sulfonate monooxygenase system iron-sulfur subunit TsaM1 [Hartmannibacter diazotrophicus]|uniref:Toluene-4-sulfonate monooxygenase system iron-sulfur subunit TsaM1 n=1 Tax=Hartmannibacter diazotrophicus TaxID=1482074 RepID=A0A2C9D1P7_9HYPH|nr:aromatic ring-hydroxylating dioxygenase subunit alpha [Hartmannibacter diazotrophicus]SON54143.1 Toluene-4-sulfonate monooxygenase system iron-sulfur subunit TsaM1 [Hartmannibacter diazotrophicus]